nr:12964_t:CDS:2 [Entrophospora candida]
MVARISKKTVQNNNKKLLTPITEEDTTSASITTLPSYTPFATSTLSRTQSKNSSKSSKSSRLTKLSLSSRIFNGGVVDDYKDKKSDHQSINDKSKYNVDCDNEENELLPEYSCTVNHSGFVLVKKEFTRKGLKATKRSWQRRYLYLWGTFLRIYAHEPDNTNIAKPLNRFSMQDAQVELAIDYPKRKHVLRIKFKTGHQYLIQADDKEECVTWIERLQSSCNISSTIDERQMPMFITLPTRRRNNGGNISSGVDVTNIIHNDGYDNYGTSLASTSLTYQRFNEIAREIQQVQITNSSINYQLSW